MSVPPETPREERRVGAEFDLQPYERKLTCGCFMALVGDTWRVTGSAFLCPEKHDWYAALAPELVDLLAVARRV